MASDGDPQAVQLQANDGVQMTLGAANPGAANIVPPQPGAGGRNSSDRKVEDVDHFKKGAVKAEFSPDRGSAQFPNARETHDKLKGAGADMSVADYLAISERFHQIHGTTNNIGSVHGAVSTGANAALNSNFQHAQSTAGGSAGVNPSSLSWPYCAFEACADQLDQLCLLVAAAALHGIAPSAIRAAARDLTQRVDKDIAKPKEPIIGFRIHSADRMFVAARISVATDTLGQQRLTLSQEDARDILTYAWSQLSVTINWTEHLDHWLETLGHHADRDVSECAGRAAGVLWLSGHRLVETAWLPQWIEAENTLPLRAVDGCYTSAFDSPLKDVITRRLKHWGHIGEGVDGVFALSHLTSNSMGWKAPEACLAGLEILALKPSMTAMMHADRGYSSLFARFSEIPERCTMPFESLLRAFAEANKESKLLERRAKFLQATLCALSMLDTVARGSDGKKRLVLLRVLETATDLQPVAQVMNLCLRPSELLSNAVADLRALFYEALDQPANSDQEVGVLRLVKAMHAIGDDNDRSSLLNYVEEWSGLATEDRRPGAPAAQDLFRQINS